MAQLSAEAKVLLSVMAAFASSGADADVRQVLDRKLGAGWVLDFLNARSDDERVDVLHRRLRLVESHYNRSHVENVSQQTAFEDGGAR
jgi:hypothetical protein